MLPKLLRSAKNELGNDCINQRHCSAAFASGRRAPCAWLRRVPGAPCRKISVDFWLPRACRAFSDKETTGRPSELLQDAAPVVRSGPPVKPNRPPIVGSGKVSLAPVACCRRASRASWKLTSEAMRLAPTFFQINGDDCRRRAAQVVLDAGQDVEFHPRPSNSSTPLLEF